MEDDFSAGECGVEDGVIADAAADHLCRGCGALQVRLPAVGEIIQDPDGGAALHQCVSNMAADEARAAGDTYSAACVGRAVSFECVVEH